MQYSTNIFTNLTFGFETIFVLTFSFLTFRYFLGWSSETSSWKETTGNNYIKALNIVDIFTKNKF